MSKTTNRLNPTKCPFCSPSSLACGWEGHDATYPSPQEVGDRERAAKAATQCPMGSSRVCDKCAGYVSLYPQPVNGTMQWWPRWHACVSA